MRYIVQTESPGPDHPNNILYFIYDNKFKCRVLSYGNIYCSLDADNIKNTLNKSDKQNEVQTEEPNRKDYENFSV